MSESGNSFISFAVLSGLVFQNTAVVLLMRYTRVSKQNDGEAFITSTIVLVTELLKFMLSGTLVFIYEANTCSRFMRLISMEVLGHPKAFFAMSIPSFIYVIQNNLIYIAISNLEAAVFQVTYQMKLFLAAVCARVFLKRRLSLKKWFAVFMLFIGVVFVQMPKSQSTEEDFSSSERGSSDMLRGLLMPSKLPLITFDFVSSLGLAAALGASFLSALAGTYIELVMKNNVSDGKRPQSIWLKNFQLAFFSLFFAAIACVTKDGNEIHERGFFASYDVFVWLVVLLQACGGLLIGAILKYASNVAKGFATSVSMVVSSILSMHIFAFSPNLFFVIGSFLVIFATILYSRRDDLQQTLPK